MSLQNNAELIDQPVANDGADEFGDFLISQMQQIQEAVNTSESSRLASEDTEPADAASSVSPDLQDDQVAESDDVLPEDAFLSDDESEQHIKAHNDALDDSVASPSVAAESGEALEEPGNDASQLDTPFLGFSSARELMGKGGSLDMAMSGLRKPPVLDNEPVADPAHRQTVEMNAASAALMMGGAGLMKIGQLVGKGVGSSVGAVGSGLSRWQIQKAEKEMNTSLSVLSAGLENLRHKGLGQLDDKGVGLAERQEMAKQFFASPGNGVLLEQLFADADRLKHKARVLLEKSVKDDSSADAVAEHVLEPLRRLTDKNEQMMESLKLGDETLLDRMDSAMNSLFSMLKNMLQKLADTLGLGKGEKPEASAAKPGPAMC